MNDEQQPTPEPAPEVQEIQESPFGPTVTLDLNYGYNDYLAASSDTLNRIQQAGYPGDPRKTANMLIFEIFNYIEGLLPGIDIREAAAFYGAAIGIGLGGYVADGTMPISAADQIAGVFYSAMRNAIPVAVQAAEAATEQVTTGLVGPDGQPVSSKVGGKIMPMPKRKKRGGKKRRRKK